MNMSRRKTKEEFIVDSIKIHGEKYNYDESNYINNNIKIKIICPTHGEFFVRPNDHLSKKVGCTKCHNAGISKGINVGKTIIKRFNEIHNFKYDYSQSCYIKTDIKIDIICPIHGLFKQSPHHHLNGTGCQKCGNVYKKTNEEFIFEANNIHNDIYDYSNCFYKNNREKVKVSCQKHGIFKVTPNDHLSKKSGCPKCRYSKGEIRIENYLKENNIDYKSQYVFGDCKNINNLVFDFYLPILNTCIEFDGKLHFMSIDFFGGKEQLEKIKKRDKIKTQYCKNKKINLIRIRYNDFDNIESILDKIIN
jgi:very-short-patch-repair endonuclease